MFFTKNRQLIRWVIIIASFAIISLILWNTYTFFQKFKEEERAKMEIWSDAQKIFSSDENNPNFTYLLKILNSNNTTPILVVNVDGSISNFNNIDFIGNDASEYVKNNKDNLIKQFESENTPIDISYIDPSTQQKILASKLYYGNAPLLNKLKYYPLALLLIIFLFAAVVYFFYRSSKIATQNKLWSGMAKETAHQIGTPLSSLIGWAEILKIENVNPEYIKEIEKDIDRLQTITERFSKIGSLPTLEKADVVAETITAFDYLKTRSSKLVNFSIEVPNAPIYVNLNKQLYGWTIENLVKNAIDAMKGKGDLKVEITQLESRVKIKVYDSGKGLSKSEFNTIFEPGHTTKKRGWGLGLSLARRIVEDFHDGKIKVAASEIGKGTTMQISLKNSIIMKKQWITVKEVALNNNCPECYNKESLAITFKQEYIDTKLSKSITQNITTFMHCNNCDTAIYPERWTKDIERIYDYKMKAFEPKKASKKYKPLFWILIAVGIAVVISALVLVATL